MNGRRMEKLAPSGVRRKWIWEQQQQQNIETNRIREKSGFPLAVQVCKEVVVGSRASLKKIENGSCLKRREQAICFCQFRQEGFFASCWNTQVEASLSHISEKSLTWWIHLLGVSPVFNTCSDTVCKFESYFDHKYYYFFCVCQVSFTAPVRAL